MDHTITTRIISMEDILDAECFNIVDIINVMEKALVSYKNGRILLPDKISQVFDEESQRRINCMPATLLDQRICGVKWVSVFPDNPQKNNKPNVSGLIVLSEIDTGLPIAVMDGTFITAVRTACMGAMSSKYLAKKNCRTIGIIGSGEQAKMHLMAIKSVHPEIKICRVASRKSSSECRFVNEMKLQLPDIQFEQCFSNFEKASTDADIIVTAVSCQSPLLKAHTIKKGALYCHAAGWEDEYEVPLKADKIVCDQWESVKHRTQTISRLFKQGKLTDDDIYADIVDIVDGTKPGRETDEEFIYFNSVGLAFIDVSVAYDLYKKVLAKNLGSDWHVKNNDIFTYKK